MTDEPYLLHRILSNTTSESLTSIRRDESQEDDEKSRPPVDDKDLTLDFLQYLQVRLSVCPSARAGCLFVVLLEMHHRVRRL